MPTQSNDNQRRGQRGEGRGFASMDPEKQRAIASAGGRAAHRSGNAHEFDSEEAREAGRKGGQASGGSRASSRASGQEQRNPAGTGQTRQ